MAEQQNLCAKCLRAHYMYVNGKDERLGIARSVSRGHIKCVLYFNSKMKYDLYDHLTYIAAIKGNQIMLDLLYTMGCPFGKWTFGAAAEIGSICMLEYLLERKCPTYDKSCKLAAKGGHIKCLKWLHETGFVLEYRAFHNAKKNGHTVCMKYLIDNGCPTEYQTK